MVKYIHCEKCKKVYNTETWIGEVHTYNGICPSCNAKEQQEDQILQKSEEERIININDIELIKNVRDNLESTQISPIETEKLLLSSLEQKVNDVLSSKGSIDVLIKEIKDDLIDKAKERIEATIQSFDSSKIDAQKVVDYVEKRFDYLSEYKDYMDDVSRKLQNKPKMKVKTALEKVFKERMANMPKDISKDILINKKVKLKMIYRKAVKWYAFYSDIEDVFEIIKKMFLHPFSEIHKKLCTLPFYS